MNPVFPDLSETYRRRLATTLTHLDKTMCEFEQLAMGRETHSVLYSESNRLSAAQCETIIKEASAVRDRLKQLKEELELHETIQSVAGLIWSQCSSLWASLAEIDARRLKGYGEAPAGFTGYWDPKLSDLGEHVKRILNIFRQDGGET